MKKLFFAINLLVLSGSASAAIITIDHNETLLPSSGSLAVDLDNDGTFDINLASNNYVATWSNPTTDFATTYSLIGDTIDATTIWKTPEYHWLSTGGLIQDGLLYLGVRNTSIGNYFGYMTFNDIGSGYVSLNSYTYDDSGSSIVVGSAQEVPEPTSLALLGLGLAGLGFSRKKKTA